MTEELNEKLLNDKLNNNASTEGKSYEVTFDSADNPSVHEIKAGVAIGVAPTDDESSEEKNTNTPQQQIFDILPFLDQSYLMEIATKILNNDNDYKDLPLERVACFMNPFDLDKLFFSLLDKKDQRYREIIPFISNTALSKLTHLYIEGKWQFIDMNTIYPFLGNEDIKVVFEHALKHRNDNK